VILKQKASTIASILVQRGIISKENEKECYNLTLEALHKGGDFQLLEDERLGIVVKTQVRSGGKIVGIQG
jgi:hypothetical protein